RVRNTDSTIKSLKASAQKERPVTDAVQKLFAGPDLNAMLASISTSPASADALWDKFSVVTASAPGKAFAAASPVTVAPTELKIQPAFNGTANRMITLAALHAIHAEQGNPEQVKATMSDPMSQQCLQEAQQYLYGCVSTAYTRYE